MASHAHVALAVALAAVGISARSAPAVAAGPHPPLDAPATCVQPVGATGLPARVASGPQPLGTYTLTPGVPLDTPHLRLRLHEQFIPERVGSTAGEHVLGMEAQLLPDVDRDGESAANTVDLNGLGVVLIGTYRVSIAVGTGGYQASVIDLGCPERAVHPPLAVGQRATFWVSSEGVKTYAFSTGDWYEDVGQVYVAVTGDLDPDVQQTPGKPPHGWVHLQAWESGPTYVDLDTEHLVRGAVLDLRDHRVEVLEVRYGADTRIVDGRIETTGKPPVISVRFRILRKR